MIDSSETLDCLFDALFVSSTLTLNSIECLRVKDDFATNFTLNFSINQCIKLSISISFDIYLCICLSLDLSILERAWVSLGESSLN